MLLLMTPQDETVLLAKAFGDLNQRPFAWCFESPDASSSATAAADNDEETTQPDAAPQEPQAGVTQYMDGDAFLAMLRRHLGMPDHDADE